MRHRQILFAVFIFSISSCNYLPENKQEVLRNTGLAKSNLNDSGTVLLVKMIKNYLSLKNALVYEAPGEADNRARQLSADANQLLFQLQQDSANLYKMLPEIRSIILNNNKLVSANDKTCELKRVYFRPVSDAMYKLLRISGMKNLKLYRQYCAPAFNETGASWLSTKTKIYNPYFGKKMLECGEVIDSLG